MIKLTYFLSIFLLVSGLGSSLLASGLAVAQEGDENPAIHISDRVKIERPEASPDASPEAQPEEPSDESAEASPEAPGEEPVLEPPVETSPEDSEDSEEPAEPEDEEAPGVPDEGLLEAAPEIAPEDRYYDETGREDPFEPFLRSEEPESEPDVEAVTQRIPRTPLERISLGQLTLTAVIRADEDRRFAMVEDSRGKGYVVREGNYIGDEGGRISKIESNKVIVEEPHRDVFGKTSIREIELQLKRQAGE